MATDDDHLAAWIEEQLARAPEPTEEMRRRLALLLWPRESDRAGS